MDWDGRFQEWNGRPSPILSYQFHTTDFVHGIYRKIYTDSDKHYSHTSIQHLVYYLLTNCGTSVVCVAQTVYACCIVHYNDAVADVFNRFDLFFRLEINNLPSLKFFFLPSSGNFVFTISSPIELVFYHFNVRI